MVFGIGFPYRMAPAPDVAHGAGAGSVGRAARAGGHPRDPPQPQRPIEAQHSDATAHRLPHWPVTQQQHPSLAGPACRKPGGSAPSPRTAHRLGLWAVYASPVDPRAIILRKQPREQKGALQKGPFPCSISPLRVPASVTGEPVHGVSQPTPQARRGGHKGPCASSKIIYIPVI